MERREGGLSVQRREKKNKRKRRERIIPSSFTFSLNNEALRVSE